MLYKKIWNTLELWMLSTVDNFIQSSQIVEYSNAKIFLPPSRMDWKKWNFDRVQDIFGFLYERFTLWILQKITLIRIILWMQLIKIYINFLWVSKSDWESTYNHSDKFHDLTLDLKMEGSKFSWKRNGESRLNKTHYLILYYILNQIWPTTNVEVQK